MTATETTPREERGVTIARLRNEMGLTQPELAAMLEVSTNSVWRWETAGAPMTATLAVRYLYSEHLAREGLIQRRPRRES